MNDNRQIFFKILQLDPDATPWLGWAKQQVKTRIAQNALGQYANFKFTVQQGNVTVQAKIIATGLDVVAQLYLTSTSRHQYYYSFTLPCPCKCRALTLFETAAPATVSITLSFRGDTLSSVWIPPMGYSAWSYVGSDGVVYGTGGGGNLVYLGGIVYDANPGTNGGWFSATFPDPVLATATAAAAAAQAAAQAAANAAANQRSAAFLYDGTELGSAPRTDNSDNTIHYNKFGSTIWRGDGVATLFTADDNTGDFTQTGELMFAVPTDVCYNKADPPVYPGALAPPSISYSIPAYSFDGSNKTITITMFVNGVAVAAATGGYSMSFVDHPPIGSVFFWDFVDFPCGGTLEDGNNPVHFPFAQVLTTPPSGNTGMYLWTASGTAYDGTISYTAVPIPQFEVAYAQAQADYLAAQGDLAAAIVKWNADWVAAQIIALDRERARLLACSDKAINDLRDGTLPTGLDWLIKSHHPVSSYAYRIIEFTDTSFDESSVDNTPIDPIIDDTTITRTIKLNYTYTDENGTNTQPITLTGTQQTQITEHTYTAPDSSTSTYNSTQITYIDWPTLTDSTTGETVFPSDYENLAGLSLLDNFGVPVIKILNGFTIVGRNLDDAYSNRESNLTIPPYPDSIGIESLVVTDPDFLADYNVRSKYKFSRDDYRAKNKLSGNWVSAALKDGEEITVIPVSYVLPDGTELGMFPIDDENNLQACTGANIYGKAIFKYEEATDAFVFKSWKDITDSKGNSSPASINLSPTDFTDNVVVIGGAARWQDQIDTYMQQEKDIRDGNPNQDTALDVYIAIKNAFVNV